MLGFAPNREESLTLEVTQARYCANDASHLWSSFRGKRVLLLQGPMGPFFRHVATRLGENGAIVSKINFNIADSFYFLGAAGSRLYRGSMARWPGYWLI